MAARPMRACSSRTPAKVRLLPFEIRPPELLRLAKPRAMRSRSLLTQLSSLSSSRASRCFSRSFSLSSRILASSSAITTQRRSRHDCRLVPYRQSMACLCSCRTCHSWGHGRQAHWPQRLRLTRASGLYGLGSAGLRPDARSSSLIVTLRASRAFSAAARTMLSFPPAERARSEAVDKRRLPSVTDVSSWGSRVTLLSSSSSLPGLFFLDFARWVTYGHMRSEERASTARTILLLDSDADGLLRSSRCGLARVRATSTDFLLQHVSGLPGPGH